MFCGLNVKEGDFCFLSKAMEIASQRTKEERSSQDHVDEEVRLIICYSLGNTCVLRSFFFLIYCWGMILISLDMQYFK